MNAWILFAFVLVFAIDTEIITDGNVPVAGKAFAVVSTVLALKIGTYSEIRTVVQAEETFVDVDTIHSVSTVTIITFAGKGRTVIV